MPGMFDNFNLGDALSGFRDYFNRGSDNVVNGPRRALWNVGPSLVGRSGQGPQTGADLLSRLGMNPDSGLTHALGIGAEMAGDPLMLAGGFGGAARAAGGAAAPEASALARRLEAMAGPGLQDASQAASGRLAASAASNGGFARPFATPWGADVLSQARVADPSRVPVAIARPRGMAALPETVPGGGTVPTPPAGPLNRVIRAETPAGMRGSVPGFAHDTAALRSEQLNSPIFNPNNPAWGLGTSQFTQDAGTAARYGIDSAPGLMTQRFLQPAAEAAASPGSQTLMNRLQRLAPATPRVDY